MFTQTMLTEERGRKFKLSELVLQSFCFVAVVADKATYIYRIVWCLHFQATSHPYN